VSGLLYEMNKARTDDLVREGERQRLASAAARAKRPAPAPRPAFWPFRRVPSIRVGFGGGGFSSINKGGT
jgi:hypothetical protein